MSIILGNSKEIMINPRTRITYNNHFMIIDFNLGSFKQSSYLFNKDELVSKEELEAVYSLDLPTEIKRRIINYVEVENLKHNIVTLTIDEAIDIAKAKLEVSNHAKSSYINYVENSDIEELEV